MQLFVFQQCQWLINNKVTQAYLGQSGYIILSMTLIPVNQLLTSNFLENMPSSSRQCSTLNNNPRNKILYQISGIPKLNKVGLLFKSHSRNFVQFQSFKISLFKEEECLISHIWKESTKMKIKPRKLCLKNTEKNDILNLISHFKRGKHVYIFVFIKTPIRFVEVDITCSGEIGILFIVIAS